MKRNVRRLLAMLLAMAMVLQQGSTLGVLAGETEPTSETRLEAESETSELNTIAETQASESETKVEETKAPETAASETTAETKAEETSASETAAETQASEAETKVAETAAETQASEAETKAPETAAETQVSESETEATEVQSEIKATEPETVAEAQSETETKESETQAATEESQPATEQVTELVTESEPATEIVEPVTEIVEPVTEPATEIVESATEPATEIVEPMTEQVTEAVAESEPATEEVTESATETVTEQKTEAVTETEPQTEETEKAEAELDAEITQEVFQKTVEDVTVPMVKYTIKVTNRTSQVNAEDVSVKVFLADSLSYKKEDGESLQLVSYDSFAKAANESVLDNVKLSETDKAAYANGGVVLWKDQTIAAGAEKTFVFFVEVKGGETDTKALRNLWFVNDKAVAKDRIQWANTDLLEVKEEVPTEFTFENDDMIVTATLANGTVLPEGVRFVVTEAELPDEYKTLVGDALSDEQILAGYVYYDMHFEVNGQEIEPENGAVSVSVEYKKPLQLSDSENEDIQNNTEYKVLHLTDEQTAEDVTNNVTATSDGQVNEMGFTTDSFSGFMLIGTTDAETEREITAKVECPGAPQGAQFYFRYYVKGNDVNSLQQVKSDADGNIKFSIKAIDFMNGTEIERTDSGVKKKYECVLKQEERANVNKVTFDAKERKIEVITFTDNFNTTTISEVKIADDELVFHNQYARVYFNRYSMAGLLNGYNVIAFTEASLGNHTVGGVLVNGDLKSTTANTFGESPLLGGDNPVPSYVAGNVTSQFSYGGASGYNTTGPLYVGSSNKVWIEYTNAGQYTYKWENTNGQNGAKQDGAPVYLVDYPFVNFDTVKSVLTGTMNHYAATASECTAVNGKYSVGAGTNVKITDEVSSLSVDISNYSGSDMNAQNTYITVTTGGTVSIDLETFNGSNNTTSDSSSNDSASIVWYFPNATRVNLNYTPWYGHVIAPNATINIPGGDYAGTLVGNIVTTSAEGHCYPYTGKTGFDLGLQLEAFKSYEGQDGEEIEIEEGQFTFTITPEEGNKASDPVKKEGALVTTTNDANGKIIFGPYTYTEAGTYIYTVKESAGSEDDIEYDGSEYKVAVVVSGTNELTADVKIEKIGEEGTKDKITFVNKEKKESASVNLKVKKGFDGPKFPVDGFSFNLKGNGNAPMPAGYDPVTNTSSVNVKAKDIAKAFGKIIYEKDGTYVYEITEKIPEGAELSSDGTYTFKGVTYDSTKYTVTVKVNLDAEEKVTVTSNPPFVSGTTVQFTNTYKAKSTSLTFKGKKVVEYNSTTNKTFTFELFETDSTYTVKESDTALRSATTAGSGEYTLGDAITYSQAKTHYYVLKEIAPQGNDGFKYDDTIYKFYVTVTDNGEGQLMAAAKDAAGNIINVDSFDYFAFTNTYIGFTEKSVEKVWVDGENQDGLRPESIQVQLMADGKASGSAVTLNKANGWKYTWKNLPKLNVDGKDIVYTVEEVGEVTGYTSASKVDGDKTTITNTHVGYTSIALGATKVFDRTLAGDDFTFKLEELNADGTVKAGGITAEAKNNAKGEISFAAISYTEAGTYYYQISEVIPAGAAKDAAVIYDTTVKKVTVTVDEKDGKLIAAADKMTADIVFTNRITSVKVSKVDVATGDELEGAHIQILDKKGNVVEEWDSTKKAHKVKGLKTGETYTLKETVAPDGYTVTAETTFTLKEDGTVDSSRTTTKSDKDGVLLVEDSMNKVSIRKVDESGRALKGATLVVKDADGKAVGKSWKTDGRAHEITGLAAGSYTVSEIEAPEGYQVSKDVPFEITGKEKTGDVIEAVMTDKKIPEGSTNSLTVTKRLRLMNLDGTTSDFGIKDATFYVALYSDEARTERVSSVKAIVFENASASSATFENLAAGTYYVGETDESGTPLVSGLVGEALFNPDYDESAQFTFEGESESGSAEFTNMFTDLPDGFYLSGRITITKKILINGEEGTSDETYYARVFTNPELTDPASDVIALDLAGGNAASVTVTDLPIGETLDSSMSYYVAETDESGNPLDPETVTEFEISIDKSEIVLDADHTDQEVVITNRFTEEEEESESESETETETEKQTETETEVDKKTPAPKTGDDTNYMLYLLLMAVSAGACAAAFEEKRRRGRARK